MLRRQNAGAMVIDGTIGLLQRQGHGFAATGFLDGLLECAMRQHCRPEIRVQGWLKTRGRQKVCQSLCHAGSQKKIMASGKPFCRGFF
jgi:hypothetical protein